MSTSNEPRTPETPWTKAKRKPVSREVSDENENGGPSNRKVDDGEVFAVGDDVERGTPSRKSVKIDGFSTPGALTFNERLRNVASPTLDSLGDHGKGKAKTSIEQPAPVQAEITIPTPSAPSKNPPHPHHSLAARGEGEGDLTTTVLRLLRDEKISLKESTELQIRHEIDLELDLTAAKVKRYEETIARMSTRLDELETMLSHLVGGDDYDDGGLDEPIDL